MIKFTVRLSEETNDKLSDLINDLSNAQKITLSKNKMITKLIQEKHDDKQTKEK